MSISWNREAFEMKFRAISVLHLLSITFLLIGVTAAFGGDLSASSALRTASDTSSRNDAGGPLLLAQSNQDANSEAEEITLDDLNRFLGGKQDVRERVGNDPGDIAIQPFGDDTPYDGGFKLSDSVSLPSALYQSFKGGDWTERLSVGNYEVSAEPEEDADIQSKETE